MTKKYDAKALAEAFLHYRDLYDALKEVETVISSLVLASGESQKIAGVKATYYKDTVRVDYEAAAKINEKDDGWDDVLSTHTTMKPVVSWKGVCEDFHTDLEKFSTPISARVVVKVTETEDD